jgi:hypothetical protein
MDINIGSTFEITSTRSRFAAEDRGGPGDQADQAEQAGTLNRINPN